MRTFWWIHLRVVTSTARAIVRSLSTLPHLLEDLLALVRDVEDVPTLGEFVVTNEWPSQRGALGQHPGLISALAFRGVGFGARGLGVEM